MKSENTVQRIKEYIDYKGISVRRFEESVGFSNGSFGSQYKNNKTIGVDKVEYILQIYNDINPAWLLTGEGSMLRNEQAQPAPPPVIQSTPPGEDSFIYNMYKEKDAKVEALIKENGRLEERIRSMTEELATLKASHAQSQDKEPDHHPEMSENLEAFTSASSRDSIKGSLPTKHPTISKRSSAGKM